MTRMHSIELQEEDQYCPMLLHNSEKVLYIYVTLSLIETHSLGVIVSTCYNEKAAGQAQYSELSAAQLCLTLIDRPSC